MIKIRKWFNLPIAVNNLRNNSINDGFIIFKPFNIITEKIRYPNRSASLEKVTLEVTMTHIE
ncbi:MAG TPA: hypothetical protein DCK95_01815, partial [Anaerolineaceae bacterium]|nr:hypothetical protein [Anaerolineaceae bacterium]